MAAAKDNVDNAVVKRNDAYTGILAISFLAMVGATVLLYLELQNYEGKTPPKAPVVEVPGVQLKLVPNSGGAPKIEPKVAPPDEMPKEKEKDKDMTMRPSENRAPIVLPVPVTETVEIPRPTAPLPPADLPVALPSTSQQSNGVAIPDVPVAENGIVPASATSPVQKIQPQPIIPMIEPSLSDAPPLPVKRFDPSK